MAYDSCQCLSPFPCVSCTVSKEHPTPKTAGPTSLLAPSTLLINGVFGNKAAATFTLNSPESLPILHGVASREQADQGTPNAELIREVGVKCISFNGIPRTINCLTAFRESLPPDISSRLADRPVRSATQSSLPGIQDRGRQLWDSIYRPFEDKLYEKLATAHPDLPVHILQSHYGPLLSDPAYTTAGVGRVLTSLVAISCLRAQTGVGPQVLSHVFGLRKTLEDGSWKRDRVVESEAAVEWLSGDDGSEWILKSVDRIVEAMGGGHFAPGKTASKL